METPASLLLLAHIDDLPTPGYETELARRQRIAAGLLDTLVAAAHPRPGSGPDDERQRAFPAARPPAGPSAGAGPGAPPV